MKPHKLVVMLALLAACAQPQKVKSAKQASAEAKAAAEAKANPQASEPSKASEASKPSEASKSTEVAKPPPPVAPPPPVTPPQAVDQPKLAEAPKAEPAKPMQEAKPAEQPKAEEKPAPAPVAKAEEKPAPPPPAAKAEEPAKVAEPPAKVEEPAKVAEAPAAVEEPAEPPPAGPRGGLCPKATGASSGFARELIPEMQGAGPKVVALEPADQQTLAVQVQFNAGAIDDPPGKAGLTRLAAMLMAEGGTVELDPKALRAALYPTASGVGVRVDKELTTFAARMHADNVQKVIRILADVIVHPRWDEKEFARLRDAAVNDVTKRLRQGDDENLGKRALEELMFAGHPYGRLTEGHAQDLKSITLAEVKEHARKVFTAARATVGVAGGYPEGLGADLARAISQLPPSGAPSKAVPAQPPRVLHYRLIEKPGQATAISMGMPWTLSRQDPDYAALSIARSIFGEHRQMHGRLMQRLREKRGLNYGDYAYIEHFEQEGGAASQAQLGRARHQQEFTLWLRPVQNDNALFALRAALYELRRSLAEEPFTDEEVARTKEFMQGYSLLFDQTEARRLGWALEDTALGMHRTPGFLADYRRKLDALTTAEVNAAWQKWVDPCQLQIVLVTPDAQATKAALLSGAPTPIHYQASAERAPELLKADKRIARFSFGTPAEAEIEVVPVKKMFE